MQKASKQMKEITFEEGKKLMLDTLVSVSDFCEKNDIKYSLGYGTLIGAIRHKGFIPWDDDIDIMMPRDDYERFVKTYRDGRYAVIDESFNTNHSHIRVSDEKTVLKLNAWRARFYKAGLWIDVFPIDKVPDSQKGYERFRKWLWFLFEIQLTGEAKRKGIVNKVLYALCKPFSRYCGKKALQEMKRYNDKDTQSVANMGVWYLHWPKFPLSYMSEFVDVDFEGHKFKAIKEYDSFLRGIYGDYMQFPPKEKQKPHHNYTAYWKE